VGKRKGTGREKVNSEGMGREGDNFWYPSFCKKLNRREMKIYEYEGQREGRDREIRSIRFLFLVAHNVQ